MNYEDRVTKEYLETALAAGVQIATGSYVGDGTYGEENAIHITFPFVPKLVLLFTNGTATTTTQIDVGVGGTNTVKPSVLHLTPDMEAVYTNDYFPNVSYSRSYRIFLTFSGTSLSFYAESLSGYESRPSHQLNAEGQVYRWVAFG